MSSEIEPHITKKYEIKKRLGKGVSSLNCIVYGVDFCHKQSVIFISFHLNLFKCHVSIVRYYEQAGRYMHKHI